MEVTCPCGSSAAASSSLFQQSRSISTTEGAFRRTVSAGVEPDDPRPVSFHLSPAI